MSEDHVLAAWEVVRDEARALIDQIEPAIGEALNVSAKVLELEMRLTKLAEFLRVARSLADMSVRRGKEVAVEAAEAVKERGHE